MWNDTGNGTVIFYISAKIDPKLEQSDSVWTAMGLSNNKEMVIYIIQTLILLLCNRIQNLKFFLYFRTIFTS